VPQIEEKTPQQELDDLKNGNCEDDSHAYVAARKVLIASYSNLIKLSTVDEEWLLRIVGPAANGVAQSPADVKTSVLGRTAKIQIVSGSKPAPNQPDEQKIFGGKKGGHVVINLGADGVLGFSNEEYGGHFFSKRKDKHNSKFEHYSQEAWEKKISGKQVVTFELDLTLDQAEAIKKSFEGEPDVDYSVLGYRCASYALHVLEQAGVIESSSFKIKYFLAVTPGSLVKFLESRGYSPRVRAGSEKRKWNKTR
jgi:hypothetical protein